MKKILKLGLILLTLAACTRNKEPVATYKTVDENGEVTSGLISPSNVAQFSDIPIPEGALMDTESTVVMGAGDNWIGRLIYTAPYAANAVFEFYLSEMPKFGWTEITVVRAGVNQMIYQQGIRIANISISPDGSKSRVFLMMSPPSKNNGNRQTTPSIPKTTIK